MYVKWIKINEYVTREGEIFKMLKFLAVAVESGGEKIGRSARWY